MGTNVDAEAVGTGGTTIGTGAGTVGTGAGTVGTGVGRPGCLTPGPAASPGTVGALMIQKQTLLEE